MIHLIPYYSWKHYSTGLVVYLYIAMDNNVLLCKPISYVVVKLYTTRSVTIQWFSVNTQLYICSYVYVHK